MQQFKQISNAFLISKKKLTTQWFHSISLTVFECDIKMNAIFLTTKIKEEEQEEEVVE